MSQLLIKMADLLIVVVVVVFSHHNVLYDNGHKNVKDYDLG